MITEMPAGNMTSDCFVVLPDEKSLVNDKIPIGDYTCIFVICVRF